MGQTFSLADRLLESDSPSYRVLGALYDTSAPITESALFETADIDRDTYEAVRDELDDVVWRADYGAVPNAQNPDREPEYKFHRIDRFAATRDRLDALDTMVADRDPYTWGALGIIRDHAYDHDSPYTVDGYDGVPRSVLDEHLETDGGYITPLLDAGLVRGTQYTPEPDDNADTDDATGICAWLHDWTSRWTDDPLELDDVSGPFLLPREDDIHMELFDAVVHVSGPDEQLPRPYMTFPPYL